MGNEIRDIMKNWKYSSYVMTGHSYRILGKETA
jgi:hypothetical protein